MSLSLPGELWALGENRVVKPKALAGRAADPWAEFSRLARDGVLAKLVHGYYALVPEEHRSGGWKPAIESAALGIAVADYGRAHVAVMGPSAARLLGVIPRALAVATIACPRQRPELHTVAGTVRFVMRDVTRLETRPVKTELTVGLVTTPEQTILDLADRPTLGGVTPATSREAMEGLATLADLSIVARLAEGQRKPSAWRRLCWVLGIPTTTTARRVPTKELAGRGSLAEYGMVESTP